MNQINAVTLGKLIAAHREGDEQKFKTYVDFIAKAYVAALLLPLHRAQAPCRNQANHLRECLCL